MRKTVIVLAIVALMLPLAAASEVRNYEVLLYSAVAESDGGAVAETTVVVPEVPEHYEGETARSHFRVSALYETTAAVIGVDTVQFDLLFDGEPVDGCQWLIARGTDSSRRGEAALVTCAANMTVVPGEHTIEITATVTQGSNPVAWSRMDLTLVQTEEINVGIQVHEVAWLLWIVYAVLTFSLRNAPVRSLAAMVGLMIVFLPLPQWQGDLFFIAQVGIVIATVVLWFRTEK